MMEKKVIIVTGANCGIGLEAAKGLCELGHDVVITTRDDAKGAAAITAIKTAVPNANVMYLTLELSEPQSIRDFVDKFKATGKSLNVLLNNAGLFQEYRSSARVSARDDPSLEVTMIVNCMGTFLLTQLLLDELKATATATETISRIVNVSSSITKLAKGDKKRPFYIDDLMLAEEGHYLNGLQSYRNSKLALNLWSNELSDQLKDSSVIVNTVCPGFIPSTNLARSSVTTRMGAFAMYILDSFIGRALVRTKPVSEGRKRLIAMSLEDRTKTTGIFYQNDEPTDEAEEVLNPVNKGKIWALCVKYSGL